MEIFFAYSRKLKRARPMKREQCRAAVYPHAAEPRSKARLRAKCQYVGSVYPLLGMGQIVDS